MARGKKALMMAIRTVSLPSGIIWNDVLNQLIAMRGYVELLTECVQDPKFQQMIEKKVTIIDMISQQILFT